MITEPILVADDDAAELRKGSSFEGFLTLELPSGMVLHDCTLHRKQNGARWVGMAARSYTKADGETAWGRIVDFRDKQSAACLQREAMVAVDCFFGEEAH